MQYNSTIAGKSSKCALCEHPFYCKENLECIIRYDFEKLRTLSSRFFYYHCIYEYCNYFI